ncbi:low molecular weight protein-tyrosine-phosphatase [Pedobacter boryungensis]|uniref:protein-tyrosine-phosphatase n=1 Tax=Pedobacter boryungensis TaxID=869962 RepID=A0ABX2DCC9_9SPHI|nr:low molecular weight protein-tyrosine-phosphatase [Pedobacter boryungensis]NQX31743.1 low molecular weight phosphotyrosine protein phosphatase [Pedobacter boryungensis]
MKILMVCLGNICRSPMAEGIMRHLVNEQHLDWEIASAGTGNWHVGKAPDRRSILIAKTFGYDISAQRGRHFTVDLFDQFDHILVMDKYNLRDVLNLAETEEQKKKVKLFLADEADVTDPYQDSSLFESVCALIEKRCMELIEELK